ncbi:hypothetical protein RRG08_064391 [Elysia crispata]|uniref:Integrase zinc-binding domain-containing protein n=1 Tax=Elysia crispata TaxID=231223 RepID=A0AAE0YSI2_9GAST|nr:hypothetical protein RRG08_064391 [Elysia crispata]
MHRSRDFRTKDTHCCRIHRWKEVTDRRDSGCSCVVVRKGLALNQAERKKFGDVFRQVIVPTELRTTVMQLAHDCIMSGHLAAKKTTEPILHNFYWLCIWKDVGHFCRPCDQCQRSAPKDKQEEYHCQQYRLLTSLSAVLQ